MSATNPNAEPSNCCAWGCPMLGTGTHSTNGTKEWFCHLHLSSDAARWQAITAELNRLGWLVDATRNIRAHANKPTWSEVSGEIYRTINLAQRGDLQQRPHGESAEQWGIRLEGVLASSCQAVITDPGLIPAAGAAA